MSEKTDSYNAESIKVLEGLEAVRKNFDIFEMSKRVKRKGDTIILSKELKIRPRIISSALNEARVLSILPKISKSKAGILNCLRTNREIILFSKKYDLSVVPARNLIELVKSWREDIQRDPLILISKEEHDLIIGSLLGDASIRQREKNSCFRVSHSIRQEEYIKHKLNLMKNFNISEFSYKDRKIRNKIIKMINLSTDTHQIFNYYRHLFYKNGSKVVTKGILEQLNPVSLAYWICDDGSYDRTQGYLVLCTNAYSLEEHNLMKKFFEERFGLSPTIGFRDKKYYFLRFKKEDSIKLISIIKPFVIDSMKYKIGGLK